jgi:hypothetical protein
MSLGEVIVSERGVYYEGGAALDGGKLAPRPDTQRPGLPTLQDMNAYFVTASLPDRLQAQADELGILNAGQIQGR